MTAVESLLSELNRLDVKLRVEGNRLRYSAPPGAMDEALLGRLRAAKPELLPLLEALVAEPRKDSIERVSQHRELVPSVGQESLWFLHQIEETAAAYNIPSAVRIRGPLSIAATRSALECIVGRHQVLRTCFLNRDGRCAVEIAPQVPFQLPVIDLTEFHGDSQTEEVERLAAEEARYRFDLSQAPLLRVVILRLGAEEHIALFNLHHIVSDGWSAAIFTSEFCRFYEQHAYGTPAGLSPLAIQYADYAVDQRRRLSSERAAADLAFWTRLLDSVPTVLELPTTRPRPAVQSWRGGSVPVRIAAPLARRLRHLARDADATLYMTLLAAFATLLHRYSGQSKIAIGSMIANRHSAEIEPLVGFFVNTLVMPVDVSGDPSFRDVVARVRQLALDVFAHQDFPFAHLVKALRPVRTLSRSPLFQVMFVLHNNHQEAFSIRGLEADPIRYPATTEKFDLTLSLVDNVSEEITGTLGYSADLFDHATADRIAGHFQDVVDAATEHPGRRITSLVVSDPFPTAAGGGSARDPVARPSAFVEPVTPAEIALARTFADVLGLEKVGTYDDFFAYGGDSLASVRIVAGALGRGYRVTLRQVFEHPTVAGLAAVARPVC